MITKAKILQLPKGAYTNENGDLVVDNKFKIYIPIFRRAGEPENSKLSASTTYATLCYNPGAENGYRVGDIVYVAFENNQIGEPVIIGKLFLNKTQDSENSTYLIGDELNISNKARLPLDTMIGDIKGEDINRLFRQFASQEQSATLKIQQLYIKWETRNFYDNVIEFKVFIPITTSVNFENLDTVDKLSNYLDVYCQRSINCQGVIRKSNGDILFGTFALAHYTSEGVPSSNLFAYRGTIYLGDITTYGKLKEFDFSYELQ